MFRPERFVPTSHGVSWHFQDQKLLINRGQSHDDGGGESEWPDWAIYRHLGGYFNSTATIFGPNVLVQNNINFLQSLPCQFGRLLILIGQLFCHDLLVTLMVMNFFPSLDTKLFIERLTHDSADLPKSTCKGLRLIKLLPSYARIHRFEVFKSEPWSSGYGRRLMLWSSWVRIPAQHIGWTCFTYTFCKICSKRQTVSEKEAGGWPLIKKRRWLLQFLYFPFEQ